MEADRMRALKVDAKRRAGARHRQEERGSASRLAGSRLYEELRAVVSTPILRHPDHRLDEGSRAHHGRDCRDYFRTYYAPNNASSA